MAVRKVSVIASITLLTLIGISIDRQLFAQTTTPQFKEYKDQYGRFSIQMPKDWTIGSPDIKQDSVVILFDSNNADDVQLIVAASDRHTTISGADYEQVIKESNGDTVTLTPGARLIQSTDCTKYVIDGNKACSMIYTTTTGTYTQEEMNIDFQTGKQGVLITLTSSPDNFRKYVPVVEQMLNSMKVS